MNAIQIIKNGIVKENPTFVLMLGMCPTLATTTSAITYLHQCCDLVSEECHPR